MKLLALVAILATFVPLARAESATYFFSRIADSSDAAFRDTPSATVFDGGVAVGDGGIVAFGSRACGGGIFTGSGAQVSTVACNDVLQGTGILVPAGTAPAIDAAGTVAFFALVNKDLHGEGAGAIVAVTGGVPTVVARSVAADPASSVNRVLAVAPSIRAGAVALIGEAAPGGQGASVFVHDGRALGPLVPQPAVRVALGASGAAAFLGRQPEAPEALAILRTEGGTTVLLADRVDEPGAELAIDEGGRVAFATSEGVFLADGRTVWRLADTTTFDGFEPSGIGIDGSGRIGFIARLSPAGMGRGIFTGPDPVLDRVIATGDPLAGSVVVDLVLAPSRSIAMSPTGQIAFVARLADGRTGVFRADPVAEVVASGDPADGTSAGARPAAPGAAPARSFVRRRRLRGPRRARPPHPRR